MAERALFTLPIIDNGYSPYDTTAEHDGGCPWVGVGRNSQEAKNKDKIHLRFSITDSSEDLITAKEDSVQA
jgi:hypothetical protein